MTNIEFEFKGKKYTVDKECCDKCKADCGRNYCVKNCCYIERVPQDVSWVCQCGTANVNKDDVLENEYVECTGCHEQFAVDLLEGKVISVSK